MHLGFGAYLWASVSLGRRVVLGAVAGGMQLGLRIQKTYTRSGDAPHAGRRRHSIAGLAAWKHCAMPRRFEYNAVMLQGFGHEAAMLRRFEYMAVMLRSANE